MRRYQLRSRASKTMEEITDDADTVRWKVRELANMLRSSKYAVVYTGAGLSTAAGIPDFRGPSGVWTMRAQGKQLSEPDFGKVEPTLSHIALKRLLDAGQVRHIISQNIDGLHLRSGVFPENLSELHGNYCLEICPDCKTSYFRSYAVWTGIASTTEPGANFLVEQSASSRHSKLRKSDGGPTFKKQPKLNRPEPRIEDTDQQANHATGRKCEKEGCQGNLQDSVIQFWEELPEEAMNSATKHSQKADLGIVLGSSLRVTPACDLPAKILGNGGRVVIVNLQNTPLDPRASLVIRATCDQVMQMLLEELSPPSRTVKQDTDKCIPTILSKEEALASDDLLLPLSWSLPNLKIKARAPKSVKKENGETGLKFESTLHVPVGQVAAGLCGS
ncbi:unnamed protein product [Calypogeia fissa]